MFLFQLGVFQERSRTDATSHNASGALPAPMSWHVTSASTQVRNHSAARCVTAVSHALTIWPFTWSDMNPLPSVTREAEGKGQKWSWCWSCALLSCLKCLGQRWEGQIFTKVCVPSRSGAVSLNLQRQESKGVCL